MRFSQVNVFSAAPLSGNPVAVAHDADGVSDETMAAFARWTNLSETTFLLTPTTPEADYRLRIFTPSGELPFAGHPTLGSCRAWLAAGGTPSGADRIVQECGAGLVEVRGRASDDRLAFKAPPLIRSGAVSADDLAQAATALGLGADEILDATWLDNGPGWIGLRLASADAVLGLRPDPVAIGDLKLGVIGPHEAGGPADFEVRAFAGGLGLDEDPVTGSLNAGFGMWLIGSGVAPTSYVARQGTALQRDGRVSVEAVDGDIWVGGETVVTIDGTVRLP